MMYGFIAQPTMGLNRKPVERERLLQEQQRRELELQLEDARNDKTS